MVEIVERYKNNFQQDVKISSSYDKFVKKLIKTYFISPTNLKYV